MVQVSRQYIGGISYVLNYLLEVAIIAISPIILVMQGVTPMEKILIVDDDEDILDYLSQLLGQQYECFTADTFEKFLTTYAQFDYSLILSDLYLGNGKTAKDVIKHVKNKTPVIVITGGSESKLQQKVLMGLGAKDIITKPFKAEILFALAEKYSLTK